MNGADLWQWWNLVYVIPFLVAVVYLLIMLVTGSLAEHFDAHGHVDLGGHADAHGDAHLDAHGDAHFDAHGHVAVGGHEVHADAHAEAPGGTHGDGHDSSAHPADEQQPVFAFLGDWLRFIGAGRVSLVLVVELFCVGWGVFGLTANMLLALIIHRPEWFIGPSLLAAGLGASWSTRFTARTMSAILPAIESNAIRPGGLRGEVVEVTHRITGEQGAGMASGPKLGYVEVPCRLVGEEPLERGSMAVLVDWDPAQGVYLAAPYDVD